MINEKKSSLIYILKILRKYSDENHKLKYNDIARKLREEYNTELERKAIARNIDILIDNNFDVIKAGNSGVYLNERDFEEGELRFLTDAIFSSKSIPSVYAKDLVNKLTKNNSIYDKRKYIHIEKFDNGIKSNNKQLFYTIEILEKAITNNKKIEFQYGTYDIDKKIKLKHNGKIYKINPYYMVNNHGNYYLVCNYDKYNDLANYKIENIYNIKILDEKIKPINTLNNINNFSIKEYIREHIYMVNGKSIYATLKINNEDKFNDIISWFGENISIQKINNEIIAKVKVVEDALLFWALQYGESIEIISPIDTKEKYISILKKILNKYQK